MFISWVYCHYRFSAITTITTTCFIIIYKLSTFFGQSLYVTRGPGDKLKGNTLFQAITFLRCMISHL